jgi:hypothetical protein
MISTPRASFLDTEPLTNPFIRTANGRNYILPVHVPRYFFLLCIW